MPQRERNNNIVASTTIWCRVRDLSFGVRGEQRELREAAAEQDQRLARLEQSRAEPPRLVQARSTDDGEERDQSPSTARSPALRAVHPPQGSFGVCVCVSSASLTLAAHSPCSPGRAVRYEALIFCKHPTLRGHLFFFFFFRGGGDWRTEWSLQL